MVFDFVSREEVDAAFAERDQTINDLTKRLKQLEKIGLKELQGMNLYESVPSYARKTGSSTRTVKRRVDEMLKYVGPGKRYPRSAVIQAEGAALRFMPDALQDFVENRAKLMNPEMSRFVEPYVPLA